MLFLKLRVGFKPYDSCDNQLISITHCIFSVFDANPSLEVGGFFFDLSKAFGRVWGIGLLRKLKNSGIMSHFSTTDAKELS